MPPDEPDDTTSTHASQTQRLVGDRYEVLFPISSGGMATVFLARRMDGAQPQEVALKIPHAFVRDIDEFRAAFVDEMKLASSIHHPNVVRVVDAAHEPDELYLAMEYVEGDSLATLVDRARPGGLPLDISMRIVLDVLAGLHAVHDLRDANGQLANVVHCDLSPQNILIGLDGVAKLIDFGVASMGVQHRLSRGKSAYMSPEQVQGLPLDRRSDVWAVGVIAWELLARKRLYDQDDHAAILRKIVSNQALSPCSVRPDIPLQLADAVMMALRQKPDERFADAATFAQTLVACCDVAGVCIAQHHDVSIQLSSLVGAQLAQRRSRALKP